MSPEPSRPTRLEDHPDAPLYLVGGLGLLVGPPATLLALLVGPALLRLARRPTAWAALGGLALCALGWPLIRTQGGAALDLLVPPQGFIVARLDPGAAWPHLWRWWVMTLPLTPALAFGFDWARPKTLDEIRVRDERRKSGSAERRERRARRKAGVPEEPKQGAAASLGRKLSGEDVLPVRRGEVSLPLQRLERHLLVLGASGSGKTETLLRLAWGVAKNSEWAVFLLDAKGDRRTQRRFHALIADAGREARLFPRDRYDGWRGDARAITNRLLGLRWRCSHLADSAHPFPDGDTTHGTGSRFLFPPETTHVTPWIGDREHRLAHVLAQAPSGSAHDAAYLASTSRAS